MVKTRVLIFAALISGLLCGCGGGGGSSSDGSTSDNVTLTFIEMVTTSSVPSGCTVFAEDSSADEYTYAKLAADVSVIYIDADDGSEVSVAPDSDGTLTIDKNDLEDGSYLSIVDSPSDEDLYYKVLSIQKELLETSLIKITRNQGDVSCYKGDSAPTTQSGTITVLTNGDDPVSYYQYLSSEEDSDLTTLNAYTLTVTKGESALVKGYDGDSTLNSYVLVDSVKSDPTVTLESLDTAYSWSNDVTAGELDELNISLAYEDFTYDWINPAVDSEADFAISAGESWFYTATGTLTNGWSFRMNDELATDNTSLNVALPDSLDVSDDSPEIEAYGSIYDVATGVETDSDHSLIVRAKYLILNSITNDELSLDHVVIGVAEDSYLTIPDLDLSNQLVPTAATSLAVNLFEVSEIEGDFQQNLLSQYADEDSVSLVITPASENDHAYQLNSSSYVELSQ